MNYKKLFKPPTIKDIISRIPDEDTKEIAEDIINNYNVILLKDSLNYHNAILFKIKLNKKYYFIRLIFKNNKIIKHSILDDDTEFETFEELEKLLQIKEMIKNKINKSILSD